MTKRLTIAGAMFLSITTAATAAGQEAVPAFDVLLAHKVALKPELVGVHPRVFVTKSGLETLRERARSTHRVEWTTVTANLAALKGAPPPIPGPQERRSQNNVAFAIAEAALAYAVDRKPEYLAAARSWTLAAIDYEPWGYTYNKPNTDLAAGHLLYAIGWAYDLLHDDLTSSERARIRTSLERHANLVYDAFAPKPGRQHVFTQNHDFIPTSGLGVAALALMGESKDAERWAALARAHHHRAGQLLSPDGYFYEGMEYWIFSTPWLVHFLDAWEHSTGESLWDRDVFKQLEDLPRAHASPRRADGRRLWRYLGGSIDPVESRRGLPARISGRHATEQLQRHVPRRRAVEGSAGAGNRRTLCVLRPQQPRGVLDVVVARSSDEGRADGNHSARASFQGLRCDLHPDVLEHRCRGSRVQGGAARGAPRRAHSCQSSPSGGSTAGTRIPTPAASSSGRTVSI